MNNNDITVISRKQLGERWSISRDTIVRWEKENKLPPVIKTLTGKYRNSYPLDEIIKYENDPTREYIANKLKLKEECNIDWSSFRLQKGSVK